MQRAIDVDLFPSLFNVNILHYLFINADTSS